MNEIEKLIDKGTEDIKVAELLISRGYYRVAVSRLYYAMFYIAEAILLTKNLSYSSHSAIISYFGKEFVKTGIFNQKFYKVLRDTFKSRQNADYEPVTNFTKEEVAEYLNLAKEFL